VGTVSDRLFDDSQGASPGKPLFQTGQNQFTGFCFADEWFARHPAAGVEQGSIQAKVKYGSNRDFQIAMQSAQAMSAQIQDACNYFKFSG
jgi:hypothetical protein